jgi:hypothetical protein
MINIPYLRPDEEEKLVSFDFKQVRLSPLVKKERIMELRAVITREVFIAPLACQIHSPPGRRVAAVQRGDRVAAPLALGAG